MFFWFKVDSLPFVKTPCSPAGSAVGAPGGGEWQERVRGAQMSSGLLLGLAWINFSCHAPLAFGQCQRPSLSDCLVTLKGFKAFNLFHPPLSDVWVEVSAQLGSSWSETKWKVLCHCLVLPFMELSSRALSNSCRAHRGRVKKNVGSDVTLDWSWATSGVQRWSTQLRSGCQGLSCRKGKVALKGSPGTSMCRGAEKVKGP